MDGAAEVGCTALSDNGKAGVFPAGRMGWGRENREPLMGFEWEST